MQFYFNTIRIILLRAANRYTTWPNPSNKSVFQIVGCTGVVFKPNIDSYDTRVFQSAATKSRVIMRGLLRILS